MILLRSVPLSLFMRPARLLHLLPIAVAVATLVLIAALADPSGRAGAQTNETIEKLKKQREEVQTAEAEAAAAVDVAQATADDLVAALEKVQATVDAMQAVSDAAEAAVGEAEARKSEAEAALRVHEAELAAAEAGLRESVITSYIRFQAPVGTVNFLSDDPWSNARHETLATFATGSRIDGIDDLRRIGSELDRTRAVADSAESAARRYHTEMATHLIGLTDARDREAEFTALAEDRLDALLYEAQALQNLDARLAAQISRETRKLAQALARARAAAKARAAAATLPRGSKIDLVSVRGIVVSSTIAADTENLLAAMEAEGFKLGGGGYRSHARQIALRRAHCGTSDYAIWQMSASRCRPPTARPGRSDHERGLAIDFTHNGRIISSRNSAVFKALKRLAPRYGFVNLPSEPWHWSNT